jgi:hypothetical protein
MTHPLGAYSDGVDAASGVKRPLTLITHFRAVVTVSAACLPFCHYVRYEHFT